MSVSGHSYQQAPSSPQLQALFSIPVNSLTAENIVAAWKPTTGNSSSDTLNSQTVKGIFWKTVDGLGKKHTRELPNLLLKRKNWLKIWKSRTVSSAETVRLCSSKSRKEAARQTAELELRTSGEQTWACSETCLAAPCRKANNSRRTCWSSGTPSSKVWKQSFVLFQKHGSPQAWQKASMDEQ